MFSFLKRKKDHWKVPRCNIITSGKKADILKARRIEAEKMALTCPQCNCVQQNKKDILGLFMFHEDLTGLSFVYCTCELCGCEWETTCDLHNV